MMNNSPTVFHVANQAAEILVARRLSGKQGNSLPDDCRPQTLEDALAIQRAVSEHWCAAQDDTIGGWKCLVPPIDRLVIGPIYTSTINTVPPLTLWAPTGKARIEPEFVFIFGQNLPPRAEPYTPADVDAAIARTHMALELMHSRYADLNAVSFADNLADGLVNQGLFIGPEVDAEAARATAQMTITVTYADGTSRQHPGKHPNGQPRAPLYWLAEFLRQHGEGIVAGQAVITGSFAGILDVPLNEIVVIDYEGLGRMTVNFDAKQLA